MAHSYKLFFIQLLKALIAGLLPIVKTCCTYSLTSSIRADIGKVRTEIRFYILSLLEQVNLQSCLRISPKLGHCQNLIVLKLSTRRNINFYNQIRRWIYSQIYAIFTNDCSLILYIKTSIWLYSLCHQLLTQCCRTERLKGQLTNNLTKS